MPRVSTVRRCAAIASLLLATGGCRDATGPVEAVARHQLITITNRTRQPIVTFVVGRKAAALINWAPCVSGPSCPALLPGHSKSAPSPTAGPAGPESEALVYWWHAVRDVDGVMRPDSIRALIVGL